MVDQLFQALKRPALFERTSAQFWDDPHISKGMLAAHLDPEWEAASRKHEFIDRSANWISTLISPPSKILDLGCGPGLYTKRFADMGYDVTGMDYSRHSIEYAMTHDVKSEYIYRNYLELAVEEAYDLITLIYGDYAALTRDERLHLLKRIHAALKPGGQFLFDVFTPKQPIHFDESTTWSTHENGGFWSAEPHICLEAAYWYEDFVACRRTVIIKENTLSETNIWDTFYTPKALKQELSPIGFESCQLYADVAGAPFSEDSKTLCAVVRK